jgi:hypothetical protein
MKSLSVQAARDLGPQFKDNPHRMVGQDGAFSFPLPDGSSFWFFGDTLIGTRVPNQSPWIVDGHLVDHRDMSGQGTYEKMINNTGLVLPRQTGENGLRDCRYILNRSGELKNLLPLSKHEHHDWDRIWCQGGIAFDDGIVLSFIQVRMVDKYSGPLPIGFEIVGSGLAVGDTNFERFSRIKRSGTHLLWNANEPHFGIAFLPDASGETIYIYGTVNEKTGHQCYLARARRADIANPDAYEFFAGEGDWVKSLRRSTLDATGDGHPERTREGSGLEGASKILREYAQDDRLADDVGATITAKPLFGGMPSEMSVSYNDYLGAYLAVHSFELDGKIVGRTAPNPWGPWSEPATLWQVKPEHSYKLPYSFPLIYAGKEHPQLAKDEGRTIYLTYIEFEEYYPHLIEVTLK